MTILIAYTTNKARVSIFEYNDSMKSSLFCPENHALIARRGQKQMWHFAHKKSDELTDCSCSKEKGSWHVWHQNRIQKQNIEVYYAQGKHIADCVNKDGLVIEFQKSTIPRSTIEERESFYKNMIWVFCMDYHDFEIVQQYKNIVHLKLLKGNKYFFDAKKPTILDTSIKNTMMNVVGRRKKGTDLLVTLMELEDFDRLYLKDILVPNPSNRQFQLHMEYDVASELELETMKREWKFLAWES